tara:strand:+ start:78 stop:206 length:129 start_codon:yes stop_codon:yes gene_type:complete
MKQYKTAKECIEQIKSCGFKDKDIPLTEQDVYYCRFNTNSIK